MGISENAGFLFTCRRAKTEFFEYDDVIHHTLLAWRMLIKECYRMLSNTLRVDAYFFLKAEKNISDFKKYLDTYARG